MSDEIHHKSSVEPSATNASGSYLEFKQGLAKANFQKVQINFGSLEELKGKLVDLQRDQSGYDVKLETMENLQDTLKENATMEKLTTDVKIIKDDIESIADAINDDNQGFED